MATEEQAEAPAYKPSPFMKAAAQIIEASEGHVPDDLHWDPLTMSYGGGAGLPSDAIELPTELMMNLVGPGLAAVRNVKPTPEVPLAPSQERARKRLQQRKEAAAREAAEKAAQQEKEAEEPLDESWIDQLEQKDAKKKAGREKAVQIRKERKKARKADAAAKLEALESADVQEEEVEEVAEPEPVQPEPEEIEEEDDMQPVEQSKQRRKRQARQAAKQREEAEQARREERREEEARLEAERKQREAEKARLEQERLEQERQERKRLEEQREAEKKEEELRQKREAEKREAERREAEKRKAEEAKERKEQKEREAKAREAREAREEREKDAAKAEAKEERNNVDFEEARADGDRRRKNEARDAEPKARQGRKQDKDEAKETGEQPTQVKSLRQTLTPSQLRRQQRKRQREARRAAEAAAREEDESEEEPYEVKPKQPERRQTERSTERERATERERQNERSNEWAKPKESRPEAKAETETEARPKAEEGKRARGGSVSSIASWDSQARKEEDSEPAEASRTGSDLRKDAEAFPTPRSAAGSFDSRLTQEADQNMMQPVMGITTLMISQVPTQTDAESFRRQLDSWGFIGTYNFFYMPPDVSEGWGGRCVFINFIDQAMANMCMSAFQQCPGEGVATPYSVQGLENNIAHFSQFVGAGDMVNGPLIVPTPTPSAWALNGAQAMMNSTQGKFSPQIRGQFHKTKMCAFHKKKKCTMGVACPFAHCKEELNAPPDLSKTKLCVNFFRRKCNDINCKFAHGHSELRATGSVYKTELCRAWASGTCKAGDTCRYAHGVKELRGAQMGMGYMGFPMEDDYMSMDGQMGCDVMGGLQGIWEDEAAAMQHYNGHNGYGSMSSSYPAGSGEHRGRSNPSSNFSSGQPQDGTADVNDAMSDMGLSDVSTLCLGEGRLSRQQTAPPTASFPANGRAVHSNVVLRVKGTFMELVFLDEEVERLPLRRSWSDGDLPQLQDMEGEQEL